MGTKEKPEIVAKKRGRPARTAKLFGTELTNLLPITKPNYRPIAPVHFEELCNIWENDRRIPTKASRVAWSLARNLNPVNVNSWWYRRKIVAEKFKITIPGDKYEMDVGIPPLVVVKLEKVPTSIHASESAGSDSAFRNSGSGHTLVDAISSTSVDLVPPNKNSSPGIMDTPTKSAYIHDSKDGIIASDCTLNISAPLSRKSSSLPPSSPYIWPPSSLPPTSPQVDPDFPEESTMDCTLVLDSTSADSWKLIDLVSELDGPFEVPSESSHSPTTFQPCQWSEAFLAFYTFPTWCFAGLRTAYDGSIVCGCLCLNHLRSAACTY